MLHGAPEFQEPGLCHREHRMLARDRSQARRPGSLPTTLPYLLPGLSGQMQHPEILVVVELLSVGRSKLPSEDPQLSSTLRHHHSLLEEKDRSGRHTAHSRVRVHKTHQSTIHGGLSQHPHSASTFPCVRGQNSSKILHLANTYPMSRYSQVAKPTRTTPNPIKVDAAVLNTHLSLNTNRHFFPFIKYL